MIRPSLYAGASLQICEWLQTDKVLGYYLLTTHISVVGGIDEVGLHGRGSESAEVCEFDRRSAALLLGEYWGESSGPGRLSLPGRLKLSSISKSSSATESIAAIIGGMKIRRK